MNDAHSTIQLAAKRSGLSAHVIRMWEKRYAAVQPARTDSQRRLYSEQDIERLGLLKAATAAGHRIGNIAGLPNDRLRALLVAASSAPPGTPVRSREPSQVIEAALHAVREMDARNFESALERAALAYGTHGLLVKVVGPLAHRLGDEWASGALTAAHEHFASSAIKSFLSIRCHTYVDVGSEPLLVAATPSGQIHELGAAIVSAAARDAGWRVLYLGASLPATEIAGAAISKGARVVALSLVYPSDDKLLPGELRLLRRLLPDGVALIAGGRVAAAYRSVLAEIKAHLAADLTDFTRFLDRLREEKTA